LTGLAKAALTCYLCAGGFVKLGLIGVGCGLMLLAGCERAAPRSGTGFDLETQAAAVERNRQALEAARQELAVAAAAQPTGAPEPRLVAARGQFDRAFAAYQRRLAAFLNVALNEYPQAAATRRVLELYADEAVRWSQEVERRGGDIPAARQRLREVVSHFEAIDAPVPAALVRAAGP
jgi:hypothetical protein